ncbi:MAG: hypothetical protein GY719_04550 [bacterium]|nr:hypothetical protein [bacterium]
MHRRALRLIVLTLIFLAAASAVHAEYFTVTLTNGTSFQTRYRPVPAEWDESVVMISTDTGNWIGLYEDEIADVTSHAEITGFGYQLDTTTLFVGWVPGDELEEEKDESAPNLEEMFPEPEASFSLDQFVDVPGSEGGGIGNMDIDN